MLRELVGFILTILMAVGALPASAAKLTVVEQVAKLHVGRRIKVQLNTGETLNGRMGSTAADQFTLEPGDKARGSARVVRFNDARFVKPSGLTTGQKWIIFGVVWVAVGIVAKATV